MLAEWPAAFRARSSCFAQQLRQPISAFDVPNLAVRVDLAAVVRNVGMSPRGPSVARCLRESSLRVFN